MGENILVNSLFNYKIKESVQPQLELALHQYFSSPRAMFSSSLMSFDSFIQSNMSYNHSQVDSLKALKSMTSGFHNFMTYSASSNRCKIFWIK